MKAVKSYFTPAFNHGENHQQPEEHSMVERPPMKPPVTSFGPSESPSPSQQQHAVAVASVPQLPPVSGLRPLSSVSGSVGPHADARWRPQGRSATASNSYAGSAPGSKSPPSTRPTSSRSRRHSLFPAGDRRNSNGSLMDIKNDMMVNWLYEQQLRKQYASGLDPQEGVVLKKARGNFTCCPAEMSYIPGSLYSMVTQMNVRCAMTVNTPIVRAILSSLRRKEIAIDYVPLAEDLRVQILPTMADLPRCQLHHFAAFIEDACMLIVWDDEPEKLLGRAQNLEMRFMEIIWGGGNGGDQDDDEIQDEKEKGRPDVTATELDPDQLEYALAQEYRPIRLESATVVGLTLTLCMVCLGLGWRWLALEIAIDGNYTRLALVAVTPVQIFASLFFFQALVGNIFQILGPISAVSSNSKYYSGKPPRRLNRDRHTLPHVTIQMPVYKEGLNAVIRPTVVSLKTAISTYEMQGGTANIFVNDDGMQLIKDEDAQSRRDFYDEHNIGWVARPAHCPKPDSEKGERYFLRRGKFKKASNMNYALHISNRVEDKLATIDRSSGRWTQAQEATAYQHCLASVLDEDEGRTWADGNIRVGDYILIIDSDTRVPHDCLLDAVSEMEQSPEVAIIQYTSGVMNVTTSFFENGVTWFTRLIYSAITFAVASGDACPFVGHNAILRWRSLQDAAAYTDEDGYEKFWSESHVSEDFDMALRLQVAGYSLRYASYTGSGFKEGVSLTVYDELARWQKYAYGCNELLFHPLRLWPVRGPFTPLFRKFIFSCIPLPKKLTICAYIGTYYAIAAAWILAILNYFLTGWYQGYYDKYYMDSFAIYISIIVVFTGLGNVALAVLRYRLSEQSLLGSLFENLKWIPMFTIFLGGLSIHLSQAIACHFFELDMSWSATSKELEEVHFGKEAAQILRKFKWTFVFCFACTALMVCGCFVFPYQWRINAFFSVYPLASIVVSHFALPVLLNPALMMFTW